MGIKKLNLFLKDFSYDMLSQFDNYHQLLQLEIDGGEKIIVAIDTNLFYYKYIKSDLKNPFEGFLNQVTRMKKFGIVPLYIIDGKSIPEKKEIVEKRKKSRRNEFINYTDLKCFFDTLNIDYIHSNVESDLFIGNMYKKGEIDYCLTDDLDIMLYGCDKILSIKNNKIYFYNINTILKNLQMSRDNFLYMCICMGCDYNNKLFKTNPNILYKIFVEYETIEEIISVCFSKLKSNICSIDDIKTILYTSYKIFTSPTFSNTEHKYALKQNKFIYMSFLEKKFVELNNDMINEIPLWKKKNFIYYNNILV